MWSPTFQRGLQGVRNQAVVRYLRSNSQEREVGNEDRTVQSGFLVRLPRFFSVENESHPVEIGRKF